MPTAYTQHLSSAADLVTPHAAIRAGFVELAMEKNLQADPTIQRARALRVEALKAKTPADLLAIKSLEPAMLTAAGVSDKASKHLGPKEKRDALEGLVTNFLVPAAASFVDELVYRFLLISGDAMGGVMRNAIGMMAKRHFTGATLEALTLARRGYTWQHWETRTWAQGTAAYAGVERSVRAIAYKTADGSADRVLAYNIKVPLVRKNIDAVLLQTSVSGMDGAVRNPNAYLALGELKGGIDPAGADEHWKTANTALSRVRRDFAGAQCSPSTFFVGAAVVRAMSGELWSQLEGGQLANAANLTNPAQLASICNWLVSL